MKRYQSWLCLLGLSLGISACQTGPKLQVNVNKPTPYTLASVYLLSHGVLLGHFLSYPVTIRDAALLIIMDRDAKLSVMNSLQKPSKENVKLAEKTLQQFINAINERENAFNIGQKY